MNKPVKCFIVEGVSRDYRFINAMTTAFFQGRYKTVTICLPAGKNIYMLYEKLKEDDFETDLIELLREDKDNAEVQEALKEIDRQSIDEVYLFFDYDIHQENLPEGQNPIDVLNLMLRFFDNETEHGKLYLSYPMVEALYDYREGYCDPFTTCRYPVDQINQYKTKTGTGSPQASRHMLRYEEWKQFIAVFGLRIQCLFGINRIDYSFFKKQVTTEAIFNLQKGFLAQDNSVFVLSAFPEFLLDYFRVDFWNSHVNRHKNKYEHCPKESLIH